MKSEIPRMNSLPWIWRMQSVLQYRYEKKKCREDVRRNLRIRINSTTWTVIEM